MTQVTDRDAVLRQNMGFPKVDGDGFGDAPVVDTLGDQRIEADLLGGEIQLQVILASRLTQQECVAFYCI